MKIIVGLTQTTAAECRTFVSNKKKLRIEERNILSAPSAAEDAQPRPSSLNVTYVHKCSVPAYLTTGPISVLFFSHIHITLLIKDGE
jgi:hypothetical protein